MHRTWSFYVVGLQRTASYPSNMGDSLSSWYPNTQMRVKCDTQWCIFYEIRGVWMAVETLSRVFDIILHLQFFSQSNQSLGSGPCMVIHVLRILNMIALDCSAIAMDCFMWSSWNKQLLTLLTFMNYIDYRTEYSQFREHDNPQVNFMASKNVYF